MTKNENIPYKDYSWLKDHCYRTLKKPCSPSAVSEHLAILDLIKEHEERNCVLDKIRAEIEQAADKQFQIAMGVSDLNERYAHIQMENAYRHSLSVIDKYKASPAGAESEDKE